MTEGMPGIDPGIIASKVPEEILGEIPGGISVKNIAITGESLRKISTTILVENSQNKCMK